MRATSPLLPLAALLLASPAAARDTSVNAWTNAGLKAPFSDDGAFLLQEELRMNLTDGVVDELNTQMSFKQRVHERVGLAAHYRLDLEDWQEDPTADHRFGFDGQVGHSVGRLAATLRQRLQPELSSGEDDPLRFVVRTRARLRWSASESVRPYAAVEPYAALDPDGSPSWDRLRVDVGVALPRWGLDLSYRVDEPLVPVAVNPGAPTRHIVTLAWLHALPRTPQPIELAESPPGAADAAEAPSSSEESTSTQP